MFKRSYTRSISQTGETSASTTSSDRQQIHKHLNHQHNKRGAGGGASSLRDRDKPNISHVGGGQQSTRVSKSQFKSSICRIIIAISTLKSLTSSTSSSSTTTATYVSPLISLLKLFLVGFYYLLALATLLMLIIYMNHLGQAHARIKILHNNLTQQPEAIVPSSMLKISTSPVLVRMSRSVRPEVMDSSDVASGQAVGGGSNIGQIDDEDDELNGVPPGTRIHAPHDAPLATTAAGLPTRSFSVPMLVMLERRLTEFQTFKSSSSHRVHNQQQQPKQIVSANRKKLVSEAVESRPDSRMAQRGYSAINSVSIKAPNTTNTITTIEPHSSHNNDNLNNNDNNNQGQWIPIVDIQPAMAESTHQPQIVLPSQHRRQQRVPASQNIPLATSESMQLPQPVGPSVNPSLVSEETRRYNVLDRTPRHFESHYHHHHQNHHHQHHQHQHNRNYPAEPFPPPSAAYIPRQWRRPRFNPDGYDGPPPPQGMNKLYKVVLLCDKTLVSLDYIKRVHLEPKPFGHHHDHDHDFDENDIDLDSNLEPIFAASRRNANITTSTSTMLPSSSEINSEISLENSATGEMEKRSHLTEEDPLIRCDMWDLEKGLKNRKPPREILQMAMKADFDTVRDAINRCRQLSEKMLPPDDEYRDGLEIMSTEDLISLFSMKRGLIPGTKWCGLGDIASNYNDLGPKHRIDICCRAHDHCPIRLKPFRNDYGVLNIALYTKSHCDCDADFYRCLREVRSRTADMLGNLYFNVMKLQCMREERMKICREMRPIALGFERCIRYEENPMRTVFKFTTPPVAY